MTNATFSLDPADMPAFQRWWRSQNEQSSQPLRPIDIREILISSDALLELPAVLQRAGAVAGSPVVLVMDEVPMRREQDDLKPFVQALLTRAGYRVEPLWLVGDAYGLVHADFEQVERVKAVLTDECALVSLGAGTVTDITKHAAYMYDQEHPEREKKVFVCVQTANSVTAFAAGLAALFTEGVKRTVPSRYATAIIADLRVLASAPKAMTLAGLGDCCARFVAYGDWYLASVLGLVDYYSEIPLALLGNLETILLAHAVGIGQRSHEGEGVVARAVMLAGMAQSIVNMSTPISGTEHVISHMLDITAPRYQRGFALHGAQVGIATLTVAEMYQHFLDTFDPTQIRLENCYPDEMLLHEHIQRIFTTLNPDGAMARDCWGEYSRKLALWKQQRPRFEQFCANWQREYRPKLASLVSSPATVLRILADAGAPLHSQELEPPISAEEYAFAVQNGQFIRVRFVLSDLFVFLGWLLPH